MTTLHTAPALTAARLAATLAWLDSGASGNAQATLTLMSGHWPGVPDASVADDASLDADTALAVIPLGAPCGEVSGEVLRLGIHADATQSAMVTRTGEALWARLRTASGAWALDVPVSAWQIDGAATGAQGGVMLYAGGLLPLLQLELA